MFICFFFFTSDIILLKIFSVHIKAISEIKVPMLSLMERSKRQLWSFHISVLVAANLQLGSGLAGERRCCKEQGSAQSVYYRKESDFFAFKSMELTKD